MLSRRSEAHSKYILMYTPWHALNDAPNCTRWHTPSLLEYMLLSQLSRHFQIHSEYVLMYTAGHALKDTSKCTRWHTSSLLDLRSQDAPKHTPSTSSSTLPGMLSRPLPIALDGTHPACLIVRSHTSSQEALKHTPEHVLKYTPNCTR
jgi:hypothetical protein